MLDLSNFNSNEFINDLSYMFYNCQNLISVDLTNFIGDKVNNFEHMFDGCENLNNVNMSKFNWDINNKLKVKNIFKGIPNEGSFVCNKKSANNLTGLLPGGWEKVVI